MEFMDVEKLKPHSKNRYFFDDMDGEPWTAFLESIETSGIIEPIIATAKDLTIVSGHQRVRAAKKLGIKQVAVEVRHYDSEDEVLKQLIETNIRQRGLGNTNSVKLMRCEKELERIYGIRNGSAGKVAKEGLDETKFPPKTQAQLAEELGVSPQHWRNIKNIEKLAPEVQDMLERGQVTESAVRGLYKVLTPEQQKAFAEEFSDKDKVTAKNVSQYVEQIKATSEENERLRRIVSEKEAENVRLKNQKQEVREVIKEVIPEDYEKTKTDFESYKKDYQRMVNERQTAVNEAIEVKRKLREMEKGMADAKSQLRLEEDSEYFAIRVYDFIKQNGGYIWIFDKINELPEDKRQNFVKAIYALDAYTKQMIENIGGYGIE